MSQRFHAGATARVTPPQREEIRRLLRLAEFDTSTVTFQFRQLGAPESAIGGPVDQWLDGLTTAAASDVIYRLRDLIDDGQIED